MKTTILLLLLVVNADAAPWTNFSKVTVLGTNDEFAVGRPASNDLVRIAVKDFMAQNKTNAQAGMQPSLGYTPQPANQNTTNWAGRGTNDFLPSGSALPPTLLTIGTNQIVQIVPFAGMTITYSTNANGNLVATIGNGGLLTNNGTGALSNFISKGLITYSGGVPTITTNATTAISAISLDANANSSRFILTLTTSSGTQLAQSNYFNINIPNTTGTNQLYVLISDYGTNITPNVAFPLRFVPITTSNTIQIYTGSTAPAASGVYQATFRVFQ